MASTRGENMKIVRQGLVFIFTVYLSLVYMVGCARFHRVKFINDACIVPFKGYEYRTCKKMRVTIDDKKYTVPKDFETDLASIPRLLWPIFAPQYSGFVAPAILHDYLYRCNTHITRQFADEVLYSALIAENVTPFTASKFFLGVRLFGGSHYVNGVCS
jgi:hypothetical protein